jgi:hypothetical protein
MRGVREFVFWLVLISMVIVGLTLAAQGLLLGCATPLPQPEAPDVDGGGGAGDCEAACATLTRLCPIPEDAGNNCVAACRNVEESGYGTHCPALVAKATTCEEARRVSQCESPEGP